MTLIRQMGFWGNLIESPFAHGAFAGAVLVGVFLLCVVWMAMKHGYQIRARLKSGLTFKPPKKEPDTTVFDEHEK